MCVQEALITIRTFTLLEFPIELCLCLIVRSINGRISMRSISGGSEHCPGRNGNIQVSVVIEVLELVGIICEAV